MKNLLLICTLGFLVISCKDSTEVVDKTIYSAEFTTLLDAQFDTQVDLSPIFQTRLGIKKDYGSWDDRSDNGYDEQIELANSNLEEISKWDPTMMTEQAALSYTMYRKRLEQKISNDQFRYHGYLSNQMRGAHVFIPSFLINYHSIDDEKQARDYISRIKNGKIYVQQSIDQMKLRGEKGYLPPTFVFDHIIRSSNNIITGKPFDNGEEDCAILNDFKSKLEKLDISQEKKNALIKDASIALAEDLKPAYVSMLQLFENQKAQSVTDDGIWKMNDGDKYYEARLKKMTTTDLTAEQIFDIGMREIKRIHGEMEEIKALVGFKGTLADFFEYMRVDKKFYNENNDKGREQYLEEVATCLDDMKGRLEELFAVKPKADFVVKRVEAFREKSAGKAFYNRAAPDGSRPGTYYVNLYDMSQMPTYQMEALAYHEAIPGHHMQISINQELSGLPKFRTLDINYTAYTEGWGLYSEYIPKEFGFYKDPYSDFGRLAMELWRSCRLVADVGIHQKKWTREKAIEFYKINTPNPEGDCVKMVERHIVMPGQATAYKIGQMKILELKNKATKELGDQFDIRDFHDAVLKNGAVPLDVLEELVEGYILSKKS